MQPNMARYPLRRDMFIFTGPFSFVFRWQEHGGPQVTQPKQKGFGSAVLEQVMADYFERPPTIEFAATGVRYELSGSLDEITPE